MGAGNFGSNSTIKIVGGGNTSSGFSTGANQYAIASFSNGASAGSVSIGVFLYTCVAGTTGTLYVGPSITVVSGGSAISYVIFSNSP